MLDIFTQLTLIIVLASILGIIAKHLGQPTILGYLLAGGIAGYASFFSLGESVEVFELFSDLGVMFLLFLVGLEINYDSLRIIGKDAMLIGLGQVLFTFGITFLMSSALGFPGLSSFYIALALTISSTVVVINLLSDRQDLNTLHGKISVGILLVQDMLVILALIILTGTDVNGDAGTMTALMASISLTLLKGITIFLIAFWLSRKWIPKFFGFLASSQELIFLSSIAWLFAVTSGVDVLGFSKEIGGFIAGLSLANSYENFQVSYRLRPLRDFFILVFFVTLGAGAIALSDFTGVGFEIIIFSVFVLIANPIIVLVIMGTLGYPKRAGFLTGVTIAQISEFSLILAGLGFSLGHIGTPVVTLITSVGIITITVSTYLIMHADKIYKVIHHYLHVFERKHVKLKRQSVSTISKPIILIGFHRTGQSIAHNLPKDHLFIVEHDPLMIEKIEHMGVPYFFGDMTDDEMFAHVSAKHARAIISTSPDLEANVVFLENLLEVRKKSKGQFKIILRARTDHDASILYEIGADYVLLPHSAAGRHFAKVIASDPFLQSLHGMKEGDIKRLRDIL